MADNSERLAELLKKEHAAGLHGQPFSLCPICQETILPPPPVPAAQLTADHLEDPIDSPPLPSIQPGNLESALRRVRQRITTYVDEHPDTPDDGQPRSPLDGGPWCEYCKGCRSVRKGSLPVEHPDFGKAFPCPVCTVPMLMQRRMNVLFGELGDKLQGHTLDNFQTDSRPRRVALEKVQDWLHDPGNPWLYLNGPVGIGKTHLAVGALRVWIEMGHSGTFKLSRDLLDRIRQGYDDGSYRDVMDALLKTDLLVIDDLGSERHKENTDDDWASEKLFQIIGGRYDNNRRMIVTANYSLGSLAKRLGNQRLTSRILEMATTKYNVDMSRLPSFRDIIAGLFSRGDDE